MTAAGSMALWTERRFSSAGNERVSDATAGDPPFDPRSPFGRDRDRILHSGAFRRLQGKTQVFGVGDADFYRTRLTHSLECAQIGRTLAMRFFPGNYAVWDLVEAASLAHDLGHPPFGHNGEEALDDVLSPYGLGFEGNAQTLRVLSHLEVHDGDYEGLNLARGTLASVIKYPTPHASGARKYVYDEDWEWVKSWVFRGDETPVVPITLELMDYADDVAYSTHDVQDGIRARFITPLELKDRRIQEAVSDLASESLKWRGIGCDRSHVGEIFAELLSDLSPETSYQSGAARKALGRRLISQMVGLVSVSPRAASVSGSTDQDPLLSSYLVVPEDLRRRCEVLKQLSRVCVMQDSRVTTIRHKGREIVRRLFTVLRENAFSTAKTRSELFPLHRRDAMNSAPDDATKLRLVADYVAGMTDSFAMRMYSRLFLPQQGALFDVIS